MLSVFKLTVVILRIGTFNVNMLSVIKLTVVMLNGALLKNIVYHKLIIADVD